MENIQTGKWFGVDLKEIEKHFSIKEIMILSGEK